MRHAKSSTRPWLAAADYITSAGEDEDDALMSYWCTASHTSKFAKAIYERLDSEDNAASVKLCWDARLATSKNIKGLEKWGVDILKDPLGQLQACSGFESHSPD